MQLQPKSNEVAGEKVRDTLSFIDKLNGKEIVELENAIDEALAQKDAEVAKMVKEMLLAVSTFEDHMTLSGIALKYGYLEETKNESDFGITSEDKKDV